MNFVDALAGRFCLYHADPSDSSVDLDLTAACKSQAIQRKMVLPVIPVEESPRHEKWNGTYSMAEQNLRMGKLCFNYILACGPGLSANKVQW